ncbi:uncharacterized protein AB675_11640 [Cyphellophora attinorum]|uniref:Uncharacterized protein n=1 Tax=Cyphellophora attinorum TaxID=1664694 RepID=A0A0N1NX19_9EURO|nr:uncharacterized protein AB675_11640 [Phialophora attinorum]KPI34652.1 hypothetical protein AB675_11640 [Phialophora attinorum]
MAQKSSAMQPTRNTPSIDTEQMDEAQRTDGSLTPRASFENRARNRVDNHEHNTALGSQHTDTSDAQPIGHRNFSLPTDHGHGLTQPTTTASSIRSASYAASDYSPSVNTETTLLPESSAGRWDARGYPRRKSSASVTTGRKVYMAFCNTVDVVVPLDMNDDATSMRESSLYRTAKKVQNGRRKSTLGGMQQVGRAN